MKHYQYIDTIECKWVTYDPFEDILLWSPSRGYWMVPGSWNGED